MNLIQLVDINDHPIGLADKTIAHRQGLLHRAISVIIYNTDGHMLLQQRAADKYHSPLLWTNAACTHPLPTEAPIDAAYRRLQEEMGIACTLQHQYSFVYKAILDNNMIEHEYDHVFIGITNQLPDINEAEVADYKYLAPEHIALQLQQSPEWFTAWFKIIFEKTHQSTTHELAP